MSIPATPQQNHSREAALAAIAQAYKQIGADHQLVQDDETACKLETEKKATRHPSDEQPRFAGPGSSRGRLVLRSLMALLAVACIGVAAFAWPSPDGQAAPEPISTSSVSIEKKELAAQPAPSNAGVRPRRMFRNNQIRRRPRSNAQLQKLRQPLPWLPIWRSRSR